jgi:flavin-dependent dehydrogenase
MSPTTYEVAVVGGGPAGISTALHLVHYEPSLSGRVVVLERERYPRDKYCAGAVGGRALRLLEAIGARPRVPFVPVHGVSLAFHGGSRVVREPDLGIVVRRIEFDHALALEAERRGVEVRGGAGVVGVDVGADRVRVKLASNGALVAKAVVGADGVGSVVRRSLGLSRGRLRARVIEVDTEPVLADPPRDVLQFDFTLADLDGYAWDFPTSVDGQSLVCRGVYRIARGEGAGKGPSDGARDDLRTRLAQYLATKGLDISRYRLKPFAERGFEPRGPLSAPRVLLVGEAAGIDIATGEGIAQAIQYGALAGPYLARALERNDFAFSDWRDRVSASRLGWQLRQRHWAQERFYGPYRERLEKMAVDAPTGLRLGMQQFAGKTWRVATLARAAAELAGHLTRGPRPLSTRTPA